LKYFKTSNPNTRKLFPIPFSSEDVELYTNLAFVLFLCKYYNNTIILSWHYKQRNQEIFQASTTIPLV